MAGILARGTDYIRLKPAGHPIAPTPEANNKYKFGLDYLVKMICLSRCKYLIASDTADSRFARLINNGKYAG